jgi:magnesium-protoporphyrin O-methyltransferase
MSHVTMEQRRGELRDYFDRTAVDAWVRLTSDAPVGRVRATVRAGRDRMRALLLDFLPLDLAGSRILDAGCGTGALSIEAARRGAKVVAIDLSPTLVDIARQRLPADVAKGQIEFRSGDMLDPALGSFDHVVAMDSLIHYETADIVRALSVLGQRTRRSMVITFAPSSVPLEIMRAVGRWFPRGDRAPAIEPVRETTLLREVSRDPALDSWNPGRSERISSGFYKSHALELRRR